MYPEEEDGAQALLSGFMDGFDQADDDDDDDDDDVFLADQKPGDNEKTTATTSMTVQTHNDVFESVTHTTLAVQEANVIASACRASIHVASNAVGAAPDDPTAPTAAPIETSAAVAVPVLASAAVAVAASVAIYIFKIYVFSNS